MSNKTILITGGTGTFGRAFASRLLNDSSVEKVIVFSRDELKQSEMQQFFRNDSRLRYFLGDVRDLERLRRAFQGVDIVVHAAALKRIEAIEYNPFEAVQTNVLGSKNVVEAALDCGVSKVILISSDKAVEPINLYGATKLMAEKMFVAANAYSGNQGSIFSAVRYGNVIGSRGSLVELIARERVNGEIALTDRAMTRFWMRIENVTSAVLRSLELMRGGEIFVPKMKNMPVVEVMRLLAPDCRLKIVGMRPGEKLHEALIARHEIKRTKELPDMFVIMPEFSQQFPWLEKYPYVKPSLQYTSDNRRFLISRREAPLFFNS